MSDSDIDSDRPIFGGRYELYNRLARGGMSEVFLGRDRVLDRPVAVKVLFREFAVDSSFIERFRREAQAAAALSHINVIGVYDWGDQDGTQYIVMEYADGQNLSEIIRSEGPLDPNRTADITIDLCAALAFAHANGMIHRDIKPGNVLTTTEGRVKMADFGIARALSNTNPDLTQTGLVMGTSTYLSPEQSKGYEASPRSDIYSLSVVLYEMLTAGPPFTGDSPVAIAYKHVSEEPLPPRHFNNNIPEALEAICLYGLAKDPDQRYASAEEMLSDLQSFRSGLGAPIAQAARSSAAAQADAEAGGMPGGGTGTGGSSAGQATAGSAALTGVDAANAAATDAALASGQAGGSGDFSGHGQGGSGQTGGSMAGDIGAAAGSSGELSTGPSAGPSTLPSTGPSAGLSGGAANGGNMAGGNGDFGAGGSGQGGGTAGGNAGADGDSGSTAQTVEAPDRTPVWIAVLVVLLIIIAGLVFLLVNSIDTSNDTAGEDTAAVQLEVPELIGLHWEEAEDLLRGQGFEYITVEFEEREDIAENLVFAQEPLPGEQISPAETTANPISLLVSKGLNTVRVPEVSNRRFIEAEQILVAAGFTVDRIDIRSDEAEAGIVIEQSVPSTQERPQGTIITLTVSTGRGEVAVPNVEGQTFDDARVALARAGLVEQVERAYSTLVPIDSVISTDPAPGEGLSRGSTVTLLLSDGPEELLVPTISALGNPDDPQQIVASLQALGFISRVVDATGGQAAGQAHRVIGLDPIPGSLLLAGSEVLVLIGFETGNAVVPTISSLGTTNPSSVEAKLNELGFTTVQAVREVPAESPDIGQVIAFDPPAGTAVYSDTQIVTVIVGIIGSGGN